MDQQAAAVTALGRPGDFVPAIKEVTFLRANKALAGAGRARFRAKLRDHAATLEGAAQPLGHAAITFLRLQLPPRMTLRVRKTT